VWKYLDGGLGRMMDHAVVSNEQVNWSCTSSDDDLTGCEPEIRLEEKDVIKCAWLNNTLLDMVAQDEVKSIELHVERARLLCERGVGSGDFESGEQELLSEFDKYRNSDGNFLPNILFLVKIGT
jgi:hypothetical protein